MTSVLNMSSPNTETSEEEAGRKTCSYFSVGVLVGLQIQGPGGPWRVSKSSADPGCSGQRDSRVGRVALDK